MLKEKTVEAATSGTASANSSLLAEMFQVGLYKRTQGKMTRRVTFAALTGSAAIAAHQLYVYLDGYWSTTDTMGDNAEGVAMAVGAGVFAVCAWICFRLVNYPRFADFLIAVEAEMNKVSWPARAVLVRSSLVVIICLFVLAFAMWLLDIVWVGVFKATDVLRF